MKAKEDWAEKVSDVVGGTDATMRPLLRHNTEKRINLSELLAESTEDTFLGVLTELFSIAQGKHFNAISRLGLLPAIVHLSHLNVGSKTVQHKATAAIAKLAVQDSYREKLAEAGAIPPLKEIVDAHTTTSDEEQEEITLVALEALRNLARSHKMKEVLRVGGFTEAIIQLLKEGRDSAVSAAAVGVVRNLAVSPFNQEVLRKAGAIPLLIDFLHFGASSDSAAAAAAALGNLAIDSESNKEAIHKSGALDALIALLKMTNPDSNWQPTAGAAKAADALKSLAVNSNENKKAITESGGVDAIVSVFRAGILQERELQDELSRELLESCAGALLNISSQNTVALKKYQEAGINIRLLKEFHGMQVGSESGQPQAAKPLTPSVKHKDKNVERSFDEIRAAMRNHNCGSSVKERRAGEKPTPRAGDKPTPRQAAKERGASKGKG